jgi:hypothetical protein
MTSKAPLYLGIAGLFVAWYYGRKSILLAQGNIQKSSQPPLLPSRQIGTGDMAPIWGGTGLSGVLPSAQIGNGFIDPITGQAGVVIDPRTGDISAPLGTDQFLPAIDPNNPILAQDYQNVGLPDVHPQYIFSGPYAGDTWGGLYDSDGYKVATGISGYDDNGNFVTLG